MRLEREKILKQNRLEKLIKQRREENGKRED